jgi:hypothetical protein
MRGLGNGCYPEEQMSSYPKSKTRKYQLSSFVGIILAYKNNFVTFYTLLPCAGIPAYVSAYTRL